MFLTILLLRFYGVIGIRRHRSIVLGMFHPHNHFSKLHPTSCELASGMCRSSPVSVDALIVFSSNVFFFIFIGAHPLCDSTCFISNLQHGLRVAFVRRRFHPTVFTSFPSKDASMPPCDMRHIFSYVATPRTLVMLFHQ
jgi:hypothetical protein